ncbi:non-canonical purine NTP pyrophosphatase [bacterium]|nr:non-canonical purine NTP pyrophosphatase [bacterium]
MRLLFGTTSKGKWSEASQALPSLEVLFPRDLGLEGEPIEDGATFAENARIKVHWYASASGERLVLAEDAGLVVDALGGAPGVYSSRYGQDDASRNLRLLEELEKVPAEKRTATFVSLFALWVGPATTLLWEARTTGFILDAPKGEGGFGYDPLFFHTGLGKSFAQASIPEKASVSHRGKNLDSLKRWLKGWRHPTRPYRP